MTGALRAALLSFLALLGACSGGGPTNGSSHAPPRAAGAPEATTPPRLVWRTEWRTTRGHTVCPTASLVADRRGNVYIPGTFWGHLELSGSSLNAEKERGILLRVDPAGVATAVPFGGLPEDQDRRILQLALVGPDDQSAAAIIQEVGSRIVWGLHAPMSARARHEIVLPAANVAAPIDDNAVAWVEGNLGKPQIALARGQTMAWSRGGKGDKIMPGYVTRLAYDGRGRIAVGGEAWEDAPAGVVVFDLGGSLLWRAPLDMFTHPLVIDLQFDAEGALWVLGRSSRTRRVGDTLRIVEPKRPHVTMFGHVLDGFLRRYDARGKLLFAKTFPAEYAFAPSNLDVHTDTAYMLATVWGPLSPLSLPSPPDPSEPVTLLVGVHRSGTVKWVERIGGKLRGISQVLAHAGGLTVALAHARWDEARQHAYADCEVLRFAVP